jgi:tagatose-1,6-bisphosphate aldolase non-catalytic subunit AgaZ/GatZ
MSENDEAKEGHVDATEPCAPEPAPVQEEVHRSVFASGLVQLLLGVAAAGAAGVLLLGTARPLPGATRSARLRIEQRQAEAAAVPADQGESRAQGSPLAPDGESPK